MSGQESERAARLITTLTTMLREVRERMPLDGLGNLLDGLGFDLAEEAVEHLWGPDSDEMAYCEKYFNVEAVPRGAWSKGGELRSKRTLVAEVRHQVGYGYVWWVDPTQTIELTPNMGLRPTRRSAERAAEETLTREGRSYTLRRGR
jgi:hypothetical protein